MNDISKGDVLLAASKITIEGVVCSPSPEIPDRNSPARKQRTNILKMS